MTDIQVLIIIAMIIIIGLVRANYEWDKHNMIYG